MKWLALLVLAACGDDPVHHLPGPAGELDGLRWEIPCGADLGGMVCAASDAPAQTATITGTAGTHYQVTLHFRGVVETKAYTGGMVDGYFNTGGADNGDSFNVYAMTVSAPAQTYFVNMGASNIYNCFPLDYTETVAMDAGATVTLTAMPIDGHEIENVDAAGTPIVIPDIAPAPSAYAGQFVEVDVIDVATPL